MAKHIDKTWAGFLQLIINDPWAFASNCVYTLDSVDKQNPVKAFPKHYEYLKYYFRLWEKKRFVVVPKSRRMFMSWTNIILYLWDTMWHPGRHNAFVSKKESDADQLIRNAKFILDHIPERILPRALIPKYTYKYCQLTFDELDSRIQGFPQGSDQLRQFTLSGILGDEMAFWENAEEMYSSAMPTLEGGGRFTGISSPGPGFFKKIVFDDLDDGVNDSKKVFPKIYNPIEGIQISENPKNKFSVFQIHYSANPLKRNEEYRDLVKSTMPIKQYLREYELVWDSYEGQPVYPDWNKTVHGADDLEPELGLPIILGFDFGLTPVCIFGQLQDETLVIFDELTANNMGIDRFSDKVISYIRTNYPNWSYLKKDCRTYIDPSGFFRKDTDETTCAKIMNMKGFSCIAGPVTFEERRTAVEHFLVRTRAKKPCFQINMKKCPMLVKGFDGGYRFPEKSFEIEPSKIRPIKDAFSHSQDGLQYLCSGVIALNTKKSAPIPGVHYSWGSDGRF